jgi:hypothetical protein
VGPKGGHFFKKIQREKGDGKRWKGKESIM